MLIYPAIDLLGGRCVRLKQGRFAQATVYDEDPMQRLAGFAGEGIAWVHVVDLDGAKAGAPRQHELIGRLAASQRVKVQAGGGLRRREDVIALLKSGVARVVIGSAAVKQPLAVKEWIAEFGADRICVALDVKRAAGTWSVAVQGWQESSGHSLEEVLAAYPPGTLRHVLMTDVSRDGMLSGANVSLVRDIHATRPDLMLQASGGIAALADLEQLKAAGAAGAIVGRALYESVFGLKEALHAG